MTTYEWLKEHLSNMFCPYVKSITYTHGYVSRPTYYSGVGVRDRVVKYNDSFDYELWNTTIFEAKYHKQCKNNKALSYTFYPCYASATTRDRLNMIAEILHVPVGFSLKDGCLYADDMECDFVLVYPHNHEIIYYVHGMNMHNFTKNDYEVTKIYDKKGVRWV